MSEQESKKLKMSEQELKELKELFFVYIVNYLYFKHVVLKNIGRALK